MWGRAPQGWGRVPQGWGRVQQTRNPESKEAEGMVGSSDGGLALHEGMGGREVKSSEEAFPF